jgi:hypothetical protein
MSEQIAELPDLPDETLARMSLTRAEWDQRRREHYAREVAAPRIGDMAPDVVLPMRGSKEQLRLSSCRGRSPVALIFGSYT